MGKIPTTKLTDGVWSLQQYNITFKWISGAKNKAANYLSWLVEQPMAIPATVNMVTVTHTNGPASNTISCTKKDSPGTTFTPHPDVSPSISPDATQTLKHLTADRLKTLLQMQRTDPFCRHILNIYLMAKHCNMKQMFLLMPRDYCIKMLWTLENNSLLLLSHNPGHIWFWWKLMTN